MTGNLFDNAKFGDIFLTTENKQAVFLRFAENAEYEFAILYVEGWGNVQVFRHNGKAIHDDAAHSIISKKEEPTSEDLEEEVKKLWREINTGHEYSVLDSYDILYGICLDIANWQEEQMLKNAIPIKIDSGGSCGPFNEGMWIQAILLSSKRINLGNKYKHMIIEVKED